ncbi:MAG TPA: hypothetical protein VK669_04415 [Candidatus Limnocylindrales bacterium]|nr:hypothetical protein [Candidatus Limnocylindrales bacterium]
MRGTNYDVFQSVGLYPTSATSDDYSYSRTFVDATKTKVRAYTLETGTEFQPPYAEALNIINEVKAGLVKFCTACLCVVDSMAKVQKVELDLVALQNFRDDTLKRSPVGSRWVGLLETHGGEALAIVVDDPELHGEAAQVLRELGPAVTSATPVPITPQLVERARNVLERLHGRAGPELRSAIREGQGALQHFSGKPPHEGLRAAERADEEKRR